MLNNLDGLTVLYGALTDLSSMRNLPPLPVFSDDVLSFLDRFSQLTMRDGEAKKWPDVISLGFWCRRSAVEKMRLTFGELTHRVGRGLTFHITPGNVAANFAYSLFTGLLSGNANIIRLPGRDHPQSAIIIRLLKEALRQYPSLSPYICLVSYDRQQWINDALSSLCDIRIIWGGDKTIEQIRRSPLNPRALDITFSDRYSIAAINADSYMAHPNKTQLAQAFYNDTLLNDQNACSSPALIVWVGKETDTARTLFWENFQALAEKRYLLEPFMATEKLARLCLLSNEFPGIKKIPSRSNLIVRVELSTLDACILSQRGNCGFFMEYVAKNLNDITVVCSERCQTLATFGIARTELSVWLKEAKPKGVDRIVPFGRTLDFSILWDGYDLITMLSKKTSIVI